MWAARARRPGLMRPAGHSFFFLILFSAFTFRRSLDIIRNRNHSNIISRIADASSARLTFVCLLFLSVLSSVIGLVFQRGCYALNLLFLPKPIHCVFQFEERRYLRYYSYASKISFALNNVGMLCMKRATSARSRKALSLYIDPVHGLCWGGNAFWNKQFPGAEIGFNKKPVP